MFAWQEATVGSGLTLHAPLNLRTDIATLQAEFDALDASLPPDQRDFFSGDGEWTSITLVSQPLTKDVSLKDAATPLLDRMPSVRALLERFAAPVFRCCISRQPPRGRLAWHFDNQALHLPECRLLVPIHAPPGAKTLIGSETVAYPEGVAWTGDFSFPHQVENDADRQRIILLIDAPSTDWVRGLAPAALAENAPLRHQLAETARNAFQEWRSAR
jgi:hypothetical protein